MSNLLLDATPEVCTTCVEGFGYALLDGGCFKDFPSFESLNCTANYLEDNKPQGSDTIYSSSCFTCICDLIEDIPDLPELVKEGLKALCKLITSNQSPATVSTELAGCSSTDCSACTASGYSACIKAVSRYFSKIMDF